MCGGEEGKDGAPGPAARTHSEHPPPVRADVREGVAAAAALGELDEHPREGVPQRKLRVLEQVQVDAPAVRLTVHDGVVDAVTLLLVDHAEHTLVEGSKEGLALNLRAIGLDGVGRREAQAATLVRDERASGEPLAALAAGDCVPGEGHDNIADPRGDRPLVLALRTDGLVTEVVVVDHRVAVGCHRRRSALDLGHAALRVVVIGSGTLEWRDVILVRLTRSHHCRDESATKDSAHGRFSLRRRFSLRHIIELALSTT